MAVPHKDVGFHWADYLVFSATLFISAVIGLVSAVKHRKATAQQLLTGNRKLPLIPVALSLTASFMSAIFVLGVPAEAYLRNTEYWLIGLGYIVAQLITLFFIMPMVYKLQLTSGYQYLELRFNRPVRLLGSFTFSLEMILYMAVVMYAPALALSQVTKLSMEVSILATGLVCTFYTALGGIKAVVWTDAFQTIVILAGFLAVVIRGTVIVGGWDKVMDIAFQQGRFTWTIDWDPDPFERHTFWTLVVGGTFLSLTVYASNQAMLQRYLAVRTLNVARATILIHLPLSELFLALAMVAGLVMYAFYYGCDPLTLKVISSSDQIMPLFVMQVLGDLPGLPGVFVACVYSAALSTVSSGVNSLAAVTLEDFLGPHVKRCSGDSKFSEDRLKSIITIVSAVVYGLITIGLAYLAGVLGKTVLQIALSIFGMVGGPIMGLIIVGMWFPCVNSWGAGVGLVCSLTVSLWVGVGAIMYPAIPAANPTLNTHLCNETTRITNVTYSSASLLSSQPTSFTQASPTLDPLYHWYRLSYQHYATLAIIVSVVVGLIVSALTGFNNNRKLDPRTYFDVLGCCGHRGYRKEDDAIVKDTLKTQEKQEEGTESTKL